MGGEGRTGEPAGAPGLHGTRCRAEDARDEDTLSSLWELPGSPRAGQQQQLPTVPGRSECYARCRRPWDGPHSFPPPVIPAFVAPSL